MLTTFSGMSDQSGARTIILFIYFYDYYDNYLNLLNLSSPSKLTYKYTKKTSPPLPLHSFFVTSEWVKR